jgi:hypothetical protein
VGGAIELCLGRAYANTLLLNMSLRLRVAAEASGVSTADRTSTRIDFSGIRASPLTGSSSADADVSPCDPRRSDAHDGEAYGRQRRERREVCLADDCQFCGVVALGFRVLTLAPQATDIEKASAGALYPLRPPAAATARAARRQSDISPDAPWAF